MCVGELKWRQNKRGYIYATTYTDGLQRTVLQHRHFMEAHIGRPLLRDEVVHHKNGVRHDNRIENLELMTPSHHIRTHHSQWRQERAKTRKPRQGRIREAVERQALNLDLSLTEVARMAKLTAPQLTAYIAGKREMRSDCVQRLIDVLDLELVGVEEL